MKKLALTTMGFIALCGLCSTMDATVPKQILSKHSTIAPMLKKAMPAVVNIVNQGELIITEDPFLRHRLERFEKYRQIDGKHFASLGSGVIFDAKKGLIVTNAHVVDLAKSIMVTLNDGRHYKAKFIGADNEVDIAVIQIRGEHLTDIPFGDSNQLKPGDFVAAIGSPFDLNQTVTAGIVSALHRNKLGLEGLENFIQTDAPINVGNSGGALVNIHGELVGINTAIVSKSGGNLGIGFAIPSNMTKSIATQLLRFGKVNRGMIGILAQTLTPELAEAFNANHQKGALVTQILPDSPADKIGLKPGDIIIQANDEKISSNADIKNVLGLFAIGDKITLTALRNGKTLTRHTKTIDKKQAHKIHQKNANIYLQDLVLQNIAIQTPIHGYVEGVRVVDVNQYSEAFIAGLEEGDIIISANRQKTANIKQLNHIANASKNGLLLNIFRENGAAFIMINH